MGKNNDEKKIKGAIYVKFDSAYKIKYESLSAFDNSIFKPMYTQAVDITKQIIEKNKEFDESDYGRGNAYRNNEQIYNIISFVGERGSGKTSCMLSYEEYLKDYSREKRQNRVNTEYDLGDDVAFIGLSPIDAGLLEEHEGIIEVVLAKMIEKFEEIGGDRISGKQSYEVKKREFYRSLEKLYNSIQNLNGNRHNDYDEANSLMQLKKLAISQDMREGIKKIVRMYLELMGNMEEVAQVRDEKKYLVITIDDIDMNLAKGYQTLEKIRRYLMVPRVIILISYRYGQLKDLCDLHYANELDVILSKIDSGYKKDIKELSKAYLNKVLPDGRRIEIPNIHHFDQLWNKIYILPISEENNEQEMNQAHDIKETFFRKINRCFGFHCFYWGKESFWRQENLRNLCNIYQQLHNMKDPLEFNNIDHEDHLNNPSILNIYIENCEWLLSYINHQAKIMLDDKELDLYNKIAEATLSEKYLVFNNSDIVKRYYGVDDGIWWEEIGASYGDMFCELYALWKNAEKSRLLYFIITYFAAFISKCYYQYLLGEYDFYKEDVICINDGIGEMDYKLIPEYIMSVGDDKRKIYYGIIKGIKNADFKVSMKDKKVNKESFRKMEVVFMFLSDVKDIQCKKIRSSINIEINKFNFSISNIFFNIINFEKHMDILHKVIKEKVPDIDMQDLRDISIVNELKEWSKKNLSAELLPFYDIESMIRIFERLEERFRYFQPCNIQMDEDGIKKFVMEKIKEFFTYVGEVLMEIDSEYEAYKRETDYMFKIAERYLSCPVFKMLGIMDGTEMDFIGWYDHSVESARFEKNDEVVD